MSEGAGEKKSNESAREPLRILIAGGGTGGHLFPGIAIAREILRRQPDAHISFCGTARGIEATAVPRAGFALDMIRSLGLKGKSPVSLLKGLATLPLSGWDAWRVLSRRTPDVVIGVGGYSSGPVVSLAALRGIPTLLHEANALPGLTNRVLAKMVTAAAVTFESTLSAFGKKAFVSGNPVRPEFLHTEDEPKGARKVLIFGGSQGAHAINMAMVEAAPHLAHASAPVAITHQTGERDLEMVRARYHAAGVDARVDAFIQNMDEEMSGANVIVSRAGSTTLAEIAACGRAAILIPLPTATDDHQRKNAEALANVGAAEVLDQRTLTPTTLASHIVSLMDDGERRGKMARMVRTFAKPDAAATIADRVLELAGRR
jgi:UDP-N-acetylglucosamine--N-acetylmuramyl-(pentapeptide) pyrophosphoryl-undecaprenol N-acetylglucosamine transferase